MIKVKERVDYHFLAFHRLLLHIDQTDRISVKDEILLAAIRFVCPLPLTLRRRFR